MDETSYSRASILETIAADPILSTIDQEVRARLAKDPAHDYEHLLRVARWTLRIGAGEFSPRAAIAAALLHDIVHVPKDSPERKRASELAAAVARDMLLETAMPFTEIELVIEAIRDHSFSRGVRPTSFFAQAFQDADRLDALGMLGLLRTISVGAQLGRSFFHADDPWGSNRSLDDHNYAIDHFFTKLLRLPDLMNTDAGRAEANRRVAFLRAALTQLADELEIPSPVH